MSSKLRRYRLKRSYSNVSQRNHHFLRSLSNQSSAKFRSSVRHNKIVMEYDLEQKIDLEIKMREGTQKLLAACKHSNQTLEAAKSLLTSNHRMNAYMAEIQRRRADERPSHKTENNVNYISGGKAKLSISDIRIPLIWKDSDHFKNKGDYRRFAVFCLIKIGTEICDTIMLNNVDRNMTDISFDDICVFSNIRPDFEFKLEVYSHVLIDDLSIASTPRKLTKKISTSVSKTLGRKLAAAVKDDIDSINGPRFNLVASATLRLPDASDAIKTHDIIIESVENRNSHLPLFGHFCCRLAVKPDCQTLERCSGYLKVKEVTTRANRIDSIYWASLKNFQLRLWSKKYDQNSNYNKIVRKKYETSEHEFVIPINNKTKLNVGSNALTIHNDDKCFILANDNSMADIKVWSKSIEAMIEDFTVWEPVAEYIMEIPSPSPSRVPMFVKPRIPGSLYDETPIPEPEPTVTSVTSRVSCYPPDVSETCRKSMSHSTSNSDSLRSRSSSLSSSRTNSSSNTATLNGKLSPHSSPTHDKSESQMISSKHNFVFFRSPNANKPITLY